MNSTNFHPAEDPALLVFIELFAHLADVNCCIKDLSGRYVSVNDAFMRTVPLQQVGEVIGKTAFDIYPASLAIGYQRQDELLLLEGKNLHNQLELITYHDGTLNWYITSKVLYKNTLGETKAIIGMSRDLHIPTEKDSRYEKLAVAMQEMQTRFTESLKVADLARRADLSISQLERLMRSMMQISPRQYLIQLRVEAAARLLIDTWDTVQQIADNCGFSDQPSFCKQFKRHTGLSPLQYRKLNRPPA